MSEASISACELLFIKDTFHLVEEEFTGIEESSEDYVLTTGAREMMEEAMEIVVAKLLHLHPDILEEGYEDDG